MWLMMQQDEADDYVLATGETTSVRDFVAVGVRGTSAFLSNFGGEGIDEKGYSTTDGRWPGSGRSGLLPPHRSGFVAG